MVNGLSGYSSRPFEVWRELMRPRQDDPLTPEDESSDFNIQQELADAAVLENGSDSGADLLRLPDEAEAVVDELRSIDADVLAHEAAHMSAGGAHTGGASYTYATGPDGKRYAVGGEVSIDMSPVSGNPRATITKMMAIRAAALAPANPSPQDMAVAAAAAQMEAQARAQIAQETAAAASGMGRVAAKRYGTPQHVSGSTVSAVA